MNISMSIRYEIEPEKIALLKIAKALDVSLLYLMTEAKL